VFRLRRVAVWIVLWLAVLLALCIVLVNVIFVDPSGYRFEAENSAATGTWILIGIDLVVLCIETTLAFYVTEPVQNLKSLCNFRTGRKDVHYNMYTSKHEPGSLVVTAQQFQALQPGSKVAVFKPRMKVEAVRDDMSSYADENIVMGQTRAAGSLSQSRLEWEDDNEEKSGGG